MLKRLLMMTDLGPASRRAFVPLVTLAKALGDAKVILVHTIEGSSEQTFLDAFVCEQIDIRAKRAASGPLTAQADRLRAKGLDVETELVIGSPFSVVQEVYARHGADLIIMPTEGHHSLLRRVSNSATARVIRDNEVPVLVINGVFDPQPWLGYGPVVHPVVLGSDTSAGLKTAIDFASLVGAELHLLHVLAPPLPPGAYDNDAEVAAAVAEGHASWKTKVTVRLDELAGGCGTVKTIGVVVEHDNTGEGVVAYLNQIRAGSVVLPSLGRDAVHTRLMGSVAEHVLLNAPCPALIFDQPL